MRRTDRRIVLIVALSLFLLGGAGEAAWGTTWIPSLAVGSHGEATGQGIPPAPIATATCQGLGSIVVTWNAVTPVTGYTVYRSTTSATGPYSSVASGLTATTYTQSGLGLGSDWFEVAAIAGTNWIGPNSAATAKRTITLVLCS